MKKRNIVKNARKTILVFLTILLSVGYIPQIVLGFWVIPSYYTPSFLSRPSDRTVESSTSLSWKVYVSGSNYETSARLYVNTGSGYTYVRSWGTWSDYSFLTYNAPFPSINPGESITYTYKMIIYNSYKYSVDYVSVTFFYNNDIDGDELTVKFGSFSSIELNYLVYKTITP